jgi:RNA recognition motif-containing protein
MDTVPTGRKLLTVFSPRSGVRSTCASCSIWNSRRVTFASQRCPGQRCARHTLSVPPYPISRTLFALIAVPLQPIDPRGKISHYPPAHPTRPSLGTWLSMSPNLRWLLSSVDTRSVTDCNPNHRSDAHAVVSQTKSIKIIKDRDDRPKGFGYIEFSTLDGLKDALARSGQNFASRMIRISVAEPRKSVLDRLTEE